ncbi:tetratricopeptide (TPR) repeat protein [Arthrobacter pigmenti]|uniref:Tetratricopeptide (TPR) repeat protein n=1 Tax=Arthrobacter pigmenti TaxID=271432 RepID=A0A846RHL5_9MICC|nr:tetratricopeptide repeat protein [Arthrobacter pigmenti]NJC21190.1 tetratricopeptide (TPR) repeat protein [Arthrobacter pigmenti]
MPAQKPDQFDITSPDQPADASRSNWEDQIAGFWASFNGDNADAMVALMRELASQCPYQDGRADYELGGVFDSVGREHDALEYYERALVKGLDAERTAQMRIQHASTLRNVGRPDDAVAMLSDGEERDDATAVFLALALHSADRKDEALSVALTALADHLPRFGRSARAYAEDLLNQ